MPIVNVSQTILLFQNKLRGYWPLIAQWISNDCTMCLFIAVCALNLAVNQFIKYMFSINIV